MWYDAPSRETKRRATEGPYTDMRMLKDRGNAGGRKHLEHCRSDMTSVIY